MQSFSLQDALQKPRAVTQLHLDRSGLKEVPVEVLQCIHLKQLNLNENQLAELPDWLPGLTELEELTLRGNQLRKWSADWSAWTSLKTLDLSQNVITSLRGARLPDSIRNLNLSNNRLRTLSFAAWPKELKRLDVSHNSLKILLDLGGCHDLRWVRAEHNLLSDWPKLPVNTTPLQGLQTLSFAENRLKHIPKSISHCQALRELDLSGNSLGNLPEEMSQLKWLVKLSLRNNQMRHIPSVIARLKILDILELGGNQIREPIDLSANPQLRRLDLSKNRIRHIDNLPLSLRDLNLKGLAVEDWTFLQKLSQLESLELSASATERTLEAVCHLSALSVLRGLLPYGKKEKLLRLLGEPFSPVERRALLDFWVFGEIKNVDRMLLQKALRSKITTLRNQARIHLLLDTKEQAIPMDTQTIYLYGRLQMKDAQLSPLFAAKAIQKTPVAKVGILGRAPFQELSLNQSYEWYSEAQLAAFLCKQHASPSSWTEKDLLQVKKRLLHPNPRQVKLALLLLEKEVLPAALVPALILAGKLQQEPTLRQKMLTLARLHCPPVHEGLLQTPLRLKNQVDQKTAIRKWGQGAALPANQLAELLDLL